MTKSVILKIQFDRGPLLITMNDDNEWTATSDPKGIIDVEGGKWRRAPPMFQLYSADVGYMELEAFDFDTVKVTEDKKNAFLTFSGANNNGSYAVTGVH